MRNQTCYETFRKGQLLRRQHPLQQGQYKLEECQSRLQSCHEEIGRIRRFLTRKGSQYDLWHCTAEDKHLWLKELPDHVARRLGYEVLPGLLALGADGATPAGIARALPRIEAECLGLLDSLEAVRVVIRRNIRLEYWHMKRGGSLLEPLVEEAIEIIDHALGVLPLVDP
jgi:hypothetical protein